MSNLSSSVIYALDFDGVICDSVGESSQTGFKAAISLWPHLDEQKAYAEAALNTLRQLRPVIETGYEIILLARYILESGDNGINIAEVLVNWNESLKESLMEKYNVSKETLIESFGSTRDQWIESDLDSWIQSNRIFPGVIDALNFSQAPIYIITTKEKRFCQLLLEKNGVKSIKEDCIYGLGSGTKISVLKEIIAMPESKGKTVTFVEDRYETLEAVSISMLGQPLELYLATWGYNTPHVRSVAEDHPFIELIDLPTFVNKFQ